MAQGILTYVEYRDGKIKKASLEVLSEAKRLSEKKNCSVTAMIVGAEEINTFAEDCGKYGADKVVWALNSSLQNYSSDLYASAIEQIVGDEQPSILLFPATAMGKDLAPRVSAKLNAGLATDCTSCEITDNGGLRVIRPVYAGKAFATVEFEGELCMASLRVNVFSLIEPAENNVEVVKKELSLSDTKAIVTEVITSGGGAIDVSEATIIVSGGRGMKGAEHFEMLSKLAETLGAAIGASRAAVDADWISHQHQVGQTGKTVSPTLYFACGISGAIQHLAGMSSSKVIIAINKDADAPIFKIADYGIVGDLFKVVPVLTEEIAKIRE